MNLFANPPTGPVWDAASQERNWLVWQLKPDPKNPNRLVKVPQGDKGDTGVHAAADLILAEALEAAESFNEQGGVSYGEMWGYGVGYLARPGSLLITVDLDDCVKDGVSFGRGGEIAQRTKTYAEITVSGTGLRLLLPREAVGQEFISDRDLGDGTKAGLYASDSRYAAISGICFDGQTELHHDLGPVREAIGAAKIRTTAETKIEVDIRQRRSNRLWDDNWFSSLSEDDQQAAFEAMLKSLEGTKFHKERDDWRDLTYACKDLQRHVAWDVFKPWDAFCQRGENYEPAENESLWWSGERSDGDRIRWGTLWKWARENGFDIKPWQDKAKQAEIVAKWRDREDEQGEVIVSIAEVADEVVDLTRPPGLLGAIIDHAEKTSNRQTRMFGLAGGLAALAVLSGHKFAVISPHYATPLNLQVLVAAPTGAGKEDARKIARLACETSRGVTFMREPASAPALHGALNKSPKCLIAIDEFGQFLQAMEAAKGHDFATMSLIMQAFTSAFESVPARHYSNARLNKPEVPAPFVNGIYTTTATELVKGLGSGSTASGMLGRMLVLWMDETPPLTGYPEWEDDTAIRNAMRRIANWTLPKQEEDSKRDPRFLIGHRGKPHMKIPLTDEAEGYYMQIRRTFDHWTQTDIPEVQGLWARALELVIRLAGCVAVGNAAWVNRMDDIKVDLATLQYCARLVTFAIKRFAPEAEAFSAEGKFESIHKRIIRAVKKHADAKGWVKQKTVLDAARGGGLSYAQTKDELYGLMDPDGYAVLIPKTGEDGRPARPTMVRLANGGIPEGDVLKITAFPAPNGI
ncbi:PriCT-2 domain-containing protein [Ruegeria sp. HKCCD7318]|uniref:PriCT-2 domain-containing protein n=1 Tax=Ruegeria sp. HKCCD7318 TaxID=2683014 RepID=UPI0014921367|nr:DUF3987 domain-containing protein [Ruegeria sp. HKCCD7318]NOE33330.1 DUF3987 domain-containing protein [Ruegeria sp. HKCCD7318]